MVTRCLVLLLILSSCSIIRKAENIQDAEVINALELWHEAKCNPWNNEPGEQYFYRMKVKAAVLNYYYGYDFY